MYTHFTSCDWPGALVLDLHYPLDRPTPRLTAHPLAEISRAELLHIMDFWEGSNKYASRFLDPYPLLTKPKLNVVPWTAVPGSFPFLCWPSETSQIVPHFPI